MTARLLRLTCGVIVLAALALRLFPLFAGAPWLSQYFVTEDGYLMLTVARNMAIGLGMSVSDGTIPTNGVQPLATFLFAAVYWLVGGDKTLGLIGIGLVEVLWSVAGGLAVWAFARRVLPAAMRDSAWPFAFGVAALWFSGPLLLRHTMNALETGLYTLVVVVALLWFLRILQSPRRGMDLKQALTSPAPGAAERLAFGLWCGLVFLARNDGAFLVIAIFAVWKLSELFIERRGVLATAARLLPPGLACLLLAGPWMVYNQLSFGSIMPISGAAQQVGAAFGQNLALLPAKLFEHMLPMLPIPEALEPRPLVIALCLAALAVVGALAAIATAGQSRQLRLMLLAYLLYGLMLCGFYGLHFGAPHFLSRYLAPLAPLLITAAVIALAQLLRGLARGAALPGTALAMIAALGLSAALLGRQLLPGGHDQGHFQVVTWVQDNVPPEAWVGAVQTGTLGYWHDRTINLDGKVNPEALAALQGEGHVLNYVIASKIDYIADWVGAADWVNRPEADFGAAFEVKAADPAANLAALQRRPQP